VTVAAIHPLEFDPVEHRYRLFGVPVPSVTQVLRQAGYVNLGGVPSDVLERARDRGQRVHQALHFLFENDLDEASIDDEVRGYLESARAYITRDIVEVHRVEVRLWSERHFYAGTCDLIATHADGMRSVDDFKTGNPDDVAADMQTAAYLGSLLEMAARYDELRPLVRGPVSRRSIRLYRDGRPATAEVYGSSKDYSRFLAALTVVHDIAKRPAPMVAWDDER
jgi:hypothetical protein